MRKQKGWEATFLSIFDRYGSHLGLPKRSQDAHKSMLKRHSKFDHFLRASWNTIFSAKTHQDAIRPPVLESARRNVQVAWGGVRRGKADVQAPRRVDVKNFALEGLGKKANSRSHSTRRPQLGGGSLRAARWACLLYTSPSPRD